MSTATAPVVLAFNTAGIISLLIGFVLPNAVGYCTQASMNKGVKAALLAATAAVSGVLTQWLDAINNDHHFAWQASALSAVATWLIAEGSYLRIWKPSGLSDVLQGMGIADAPSVADAVADTEDYTSRHSASAAKIGEVPSTVSSTPSPIEQVTPAVKG